MGTGIGSERETGTDTGKTILVVNHGVIRGRRDIRRTNQAVEHPRTVGEIDTKIGKASMDAIWIDQKTYSTARTRVSTHRLLPLLLLLLLLLLFVHPQRRSRQVLGKVDQARLWVPLPINPASDLAEMRLPRSRPPRLGCSLTPRPAHPTLSPLHPTTLLYPLLLRCSTTLRSGRPVRSRRPGSRTPSTLPWDRFLLLLRLLRSRANRLAPVQSSIF